MPQKLSSYRWALGSLWSLNPSGSRWVQPIWAVGGLSNDFSPVWILKITSHMGLGSWGGFSTHCGISSFPPPPPPPTQPIIASIGLGQIFCPKSKSKLKNGVGDLKFCFDTQEDKQKHLQHKPIIAPTRSSLGPLWLGKILGVLSRWKNAQKKIMAGALG